jgi:hypothetical protein
MASRQRLLRLHYHQQRERSLRALFPCLILRFSCFAGVWLVTLLRAGPSALRVWRWCVCASHSYSSKQRACVARICVLLGATACAEMCVVFCAPGGAIFSVKQLPRPARLRIWFRILPLPPFRRFLPPQCQAWSQLCAPYQLECFHCYQPQDLSSV